MFIRNLKDSEEFIAGDGSILRELLHPDKAGLALRYSLARAVVKPGQITLPHRLRTSEVYYIMEGEGVMHIDEESAPVGPGQVIYIPPLSAQYIHNPGTTNLVFLCIVDPAWRKEDEEVW
jgi:mannose-6-phosphate isomerase-like protein (cupin superfamily)